MRQPMKYAQIKLVQPVYLAYADAWLEDHPGRSCADLIKEALDVYMAMHPQGNGHIDPALRAAAKAIYNTVGELSAGSLQRRLRVSYRQAVDIIAALVDSREVPASAVHDAVEMGPVE